MSYIMLITVIIASALQNIFQKQYNIKSKVPLLTKEGRYFFLNKLFFIVLVRKFKL